MREPVAIRAGINFLVRGVKLEMGEVILSRLYGAHLHSRQIPDFFSTFGGMDTIAVRCNFAVGHWSFMRDLRTGKTILGHIKKTGFFCFFRDSIRCFFDEDLCYLLALFLHHFLEDPYFLMKGLFLGLEGDDLVVVKFISAKDLVVKLLRFLPVVATHVLAELIPRQIHRTIQPIDHLCHQLLLLFSYLLLLFRNILQGSLLFFPHGTDFRLFMRLLPWFGNDNRRFLDRFGGVDLFQPLILSLFQAFDEFLQLLHFFCQFFLREDSHNSNNLLEVDVVLLVDVLDEYVFHSLVFVNEILVEGFALVERGLARLDDSGTYPPHQPTDLVVGDDVSFVLFENLFLLLQHFTIHVVDLFQLLQMLADFIIDEKLVVFASLARNDPLIVLKQLQKRVFALLQVSKKHRPIVIEVRLQAINILKVHSNKYIMDQNHLKQSHSLYFVKYLENRNTAFLCYSLYSKRERP